MLISATAWEFVVATSSWCAWLSEKNNFGMPTLVVIILILKPGDSKPYHQFEKFQVTGISHHLLTSSLWSRHLNLRRIDIVSEQRRCKGWSFLFTALGRTFCRQSNYHDFFLSLYCPKAVSKTLALVPPYIWERSLLAPPGGHCEWSQWVVTELIVSNNWRFCLKRRFVSQPHPDDIER